MYHKLQKLWTQIRWISRDARGAETLRWTNDPEIKRLAQKRGKKTP